MKQQWSKPAFLVLALITLLLPGVRRFIFFRLLRNKFIRDMGLKLVFTSPFLRDKMLKRFVPSRRSKSQVSDPDGSDLDIM